MKLLKKMFGIILAVIIVIENSSVLGTVKAAETDDRISVSMENGLRAEDLVFTGNPIEVSNTGLFVENVKDAGVLDIRIQFKITDAATDYINLLEICDTSDQSSSSSDVQPAIAVIVSKTGTVFFETGAAREGTDWQTSSGVSNLADGAFHTLHISVSANSLKCQMDAAAEKEIAADGGRNTKKFMTAFFGKTVDGYRDWRSGINAIYIGGLGEGSYFENEAYSNLTGEISELSIMGKAGPVNQAGSGFATGMFSDAKDNTWLFGGGVETQGRFREIGGVRNYVRQFEEYIRWTKSAKNSDQPMTMQRYMINVGKEGLDAVAFAAKLPEYIKKTDPKAVCYMIGPEDYKKGDGGIAAFKEAVSIILETSLHMKKDTGGGYAVLQMPHAVNDELLAQDVSLYASAAKEVYDEIASVGENGERMACVDHLAGTEQENFKEKKLTGELLNADGHLEIAKQLAETVYGSSDGFPAITQSWSAKRSADLYLKEIPEAVVSGRNLNVTVPRQIQGTKWQYALTICGTAIRGTVFENPFVIENLPEDEAYQLTVWSIDGEMTAQLSPVEGRIRDHAAAERPKISGELPEKIRKLADETEGSLTWLFMGDSITHGAAHTKGYDSISQLFEKYLKEDLGRADDIVVNTAVSGATTTDAAGRGTYAHIEERMEKYHPDIVSVMLGTNDTINDAYEENLKKIADKIKEVNENAIIIFRTPSAAPVGSGYAAKFRGENGAVARMKKVADANGVLFIDQFTTWDQAAAEYPYLMAGNEFYLGDGNIHPGPAGHLSMTLQFIEACGLDTNTRIAELSYPFTYTEEMSAGVPKAETGEQKDSVTVSKAALQEAYANGTIGDVNVTVTAANGTTYTKHMGLEDETATIGLAPNSRYTVSITALIKGSAAKRVTFPEQEILLVKGTQSAADRQAAEEVTEKIRAIGAVSEESLDDAKKKMIKAARAAYDALSEIQKPLVLNTDMKHLMEAEGILDTQEADAVKAQINLISSFSEMNEGKKEAILTAKAAYEALTKQQRSYLSIAVRTVLADAAEALDTYESSLAEAKIRAIGTVVHTAECKKKIETARKAYDALTDIQKQRIPGSVVKILTDAEEKLRMLEQAGQEQKITIGNTYASGNYLYRITGDSTAEAAGIQKDLEQVIRIPDTVVFGNKSYRVTSIQSSAFTKKKAAEVTIGKNVEQIGKNAFANCKKLKKTVIKSTKLKEIGNKAFRGCTAMKTITIKSKVIKKIGKHAFQGISKKAVIKVPAKKRKDYTKLLKKAGLNKKIKIK